MLNLLSSSRENSIDPLKQEAVIRAYARYLPFVDEDKAVELVEKVTSWKEEVSEEIYNHIDEEKVAEEVCHIQNNGLSEMADYLLEKEDDTLYKKLF